MKKIFLLSFIFISTEAYTMNNCYENEHKIIDSNNKYSKNYIYDPINEVITVRSEFNNKNIYHKLNKEKEKFNVSINGEIILPNDVDSSFIKKGEIISSSFLRSFKIDDQIHKMKPINLFKYKDISKNDCENKKDYDNCESCCQLREDCLGSLNDCPYGLNTWRKYCQSKVCYKNNKIKGEILLRYLTNNMKLSIVDIKFLTKDKKFSPQTKYIKVCSNITLNKNSLVLSKNGRMIALNNLDTNTTQIYHLNKKTTHCSLAYDFGFIANELDFSFKNNKVTYSTYNYSLENAGLFKDFKIKKNLFVASLTKKNNSKIILSNISLIKKGSNNYHSPKFDLNNNIISHHLNQNSSFYLFKYSTSQDKCHKRFKSITSLKLNRINCFKILENFWNSLYLTNPEIISNRKYSKIPIQILELVCPKRFTKEKSLLSMNIDPSSFPTPTPKDILINTCQKCHKKNFNISHFNFKHPDQHRANFWLNHLISQDKFKLIQAHQNISHTEKEILIKYLFENILNK
jgi:hypothetical protein